MKPIKKKYSELNVVINRINVVIGSKQTKVQKKLQLFYEKAIKAHHESYTSQLEELRLDNAATDDKGILLTDEKGGYKFNKEGVKKLDKDIRELTAKEFDYQVIDVINPSGLEELTFLKDWTNGIKFIEEEVEEEL